MDGTWKPTHTTIEYAVCSLCKQLVNKREIIKKNPTICRRCAEKYGVK